MSPQARIPPALFIVAKAPTVLATLAILLRLTADESPPNCVLPQVTMVPSVFSAAKAAAVAYISDTPLRSDSELNSVTLSGNAIKLLSPEESSKNDKPPA